MRTAHREARVDRFQNRHRTFRTVLASSPEMAIVALSPLFRGDIPTPSDSIPDSSESGGVGSPFRLMYRSLFASGLPGLIDREDGVLGGLDDTDEDGLGSRECPPTSCAGAGWGCGWC